MRNLTEIEIKLCQMNASIFEESLHKVKLSSPLFIKRFMHSDVAKKFDNLSFLTSSLDYDDAFMMFLNEYKNEEFGKEKYHAEEMYWIGYIYRAICILFSITSKRVYQLFNGREIRKYYFIYHTFDVSYAAERMMESINYISFDDEQYKYKIFKKIVLTK